METIILKFHDREFDFATEMYNEKIALIDTIKAVAKTELDLTIEVSDSSSLNQNIFKAVEQKYKSQNLLNLTGEKLVDLMQIDLKPINDAARLLSSYDAVDLLNKPTKEQFTVSVDTDKELERYNLCLETLKCIDGIKAVYNYELPLSGFVTGFRGILTYNLYTEKLEPCIGFVKEKL